MGVSRSGQGSRPAPSAVPPDSAAPLTEAPNKSWADWFRGFWNSGNAPDEPADPFDWDEETVAILGDAPFDMGYIATAKEYWLDAKKQAGKSYRNFVYVFRKLKLANPVFLVLGIACVQYFTALAKAVGRYWADKRISAAGKAPEKTASDARPA